MRPADLLEPDTLFSNPPLPFSRDPKGSAFFWMFENRGRLFSSPQAPIQAHAPFFNPQLAIGIPPHPFNPVIVTLSTKYFCAAKNSTTHGNIHTTLAAIRWCASIAPNWPLNPLSASVSVRFSVLLR